MTQVQKASVDLVELLRQHYPDLHIREPIYYHTYTGLKMLMQELDLPQPRIKHPQSKCRTAYAAQSQILWTQLYVIGHIRKKQE